MKVRWGPALLPRLRQEIVRDARGVLHRMDALGERAEEAGLDVDTVRKTAATIWDRISGAEMIWVAADMAAAALDASRDIPVLDPESAPWRTGLLVFERPLPPLPVAIPLTLQDGTRWAAPAPICALTWHHTASSLVVTRYCRQSTLRVQDGELQATGAIQMPRGAIVDLPAEEASLAATGLPADDVRLFALLAAAWSMMLTPTVAERRSLDPATGAIARPEGTAADPGRVTLIDLRPLRQVDTERDPGEPARVYRHRWIVRGHWRQQAHGPGQRLRRTTWVPSYTKGPAGAPLLATDKVLVWRR